MCIYRTHFILILDSFACQEKISFSCAGREDLIFWISRNDQQSLVFHSPCCANQTVAHAGGGVGRLRWLGYSL